MQLYIKKNKYGTYFYVLESYRKESGAPTSRVYRKLGSLKKLQEELGPDADVVQWCRDRVEEINRDIKVKKPVMETITICPDLVVPEERWNEEILFNAGADILKKEFEQLGLAALCDKIKANSRFKYDLYAIIRDLTCIRILDPNSKTSSYEYANEHFLDKPEYKLYDIYRALTVIQKHEDEIQECVYKASNKLSPRDTSVLYYDCTNFFFESSDEGELRKYGKSKENRPNPIVQFGLFMDRSGIPLGYTIFPGNCNEQPSLQECEKRILNDYKLRGSKMIICTDAGLASKANRRFNSVNNRDFITVSPIKTMPKKRREWVLNHGRSLALNPIKADENPAVVERDRKLNCWKMVGDRSGKLYAIEDIDAEEDRFYDKIFYKETTIVDPKTDKEPEFSQRLIATYSIKYRKFLAHKRANDLERADKWIYNHNNKQITIAAAHDIRQYMKVTSTTEDGKEATITKYGLDHEAIAEAARYDGFYAVCTSIDKKEMTVDEIANINKWRWEIEETFRIMKTEFRSRPVYLGTDDHGRAHFCTCYLATLRFRLFEKKLEVKGGENYSASKIIDTLRELNVVKLGSANGSHIGRYYCRAFKPNELIVRMQTVANMEARVDCDYISQKAINKFKKRPKK